MRKQINQTRRKPKPLKPKKPYLRDKYRDPQNGDEFQTHNGSVVRVSGRRNATALSVST